jgi:hypothetical protein
MRDRSAYWLPWVTHQCASALSKVSAVEPSIGHLIPRGPARGIACDLGHFLTIGGVSQKFVGWMHRVYLSRLHIPIPSVDLTA